VGAKSKIENSVISQCIIQTNSNISDAIISNSMIGNYCVYKGKADDLSMGDYSTRA
jgi:glucose-1-phosphate thymidylyltransferase